MARRYLKDEAIALSVNDSLELFDDCGMKPIKFVLWKNLFDELPQDDPVGVLSRLLLLDFLEEVLPRSGVI